MLIDEDKINCHDELVAAAKRSTEFVKSVSHRSVGRVADYADFDFLEELEQPSSMRKARGEA